MYVNHGLAERSDVRIWLREKHQIYDPVFLRNEESEVKNTFPPNDACTDGTVVRRSIVLLQLPKEDNSFIDICTALFCIRCIYYMFFLS